MLVCYELFIIDDIETLLLINLIMITEEVSRLYQLAYQELNVPQAQLGNNEEFYLLSKIQEKRMFILLPV